MRTGTSAATQLTIGGIDEPTNKSLAELFTALGASVHGLSSREARDDLPQMDPTSSRSRGASC
ncbi:hypothetical protein VW35_07265 [Devosia soli]|uniref:Uncharacterized protein n=1 Tax=Devosia soli TaxID=361041 RepID=A0A0F5LD65_9HYPH|nr:hypothetical protein VW35_07265 [Devosia soli]